MNPDPLDALILLALAGALILATLLVASIATHRRDDEGDTP